MDKKKKTPGAGSFGKISEESYVNYKSPSRTKKFGKRSTWGPKRDSTTNY